MSRPPPPESLRLLAELDEGGGRGVALTRLAKRLGVGVSVLMREYSGLGEAVLGGLEGPGWVRLECEPGGRWLAHLTERGRALAGADEAAAPAPLRALTVQRLAGAGGQAEADEVAVETPVALVFNGISQAVMMATPADLEAFALGFALSEGLLRAREECFGIELRNGPDGCEVHLQVAAAAEMRLKEQRRNLAGRTGCGLCGIDSLRSLELDPAPLSRPAPVRPDAVRRAIEQLPAWQPLNARSGAHHAAAWAGLDGELRLAMEDVGRHNALDKLLGRLLLERRPCEDGFVVMSSRASYELVLKCVRLGVPALATISAPTSLAVDIARRARLQLYGFCRGEQTVRYTD
ncbi:formate dehydrogenase accessory sulfurtransferase FdhD [Roseateles violae]|uniref:Sulfur carrier protein FdhD n=1 Tax=Roseateles violae TaxID=3058042 RepID=A0ABT8DPR6_9BURK|nr:formate dehydrogenase accessory sulfurtransferase FdhD [Pelomonas sp. PFR6]MDN3919035.1 formate dehydrogenase accessory sulfurtransferase FdhD [Pelomonas sp. PFR6]